MRQRHRHPRLWAWAWCAGGTVFLGMMFVQFALTAEALEVAEDARQRGLVTITSLPRRLRVISRLGAYAFAFAIGVPIVIGALISAGWVLWSADSGAAAWRRCLLVGAVTVGSQALFVWLTIRGFERIGV